MDHRAHIIWLAQNLKVVSSNHVSLMLLDNSNPILVYQVHLHASLAHLSIHHPPYHAYQKSFLPIAKNDLYEFVTNHILLFPHDVVLDRAEKKKQ